MASGGPSRSQAGDAQAVAVPDFVDPDEDVVRAWFGSYDETSGLKSLPKDSCQASSAWVSTVLERPSRPGRLGLGAEPPKRKVEEEAAAAPIGKVARRLLGRQRRLEEEEADARRWAHRGGRSAGSGRGVEQTTPGAIAPAQSVPGADRSRKGRQETRVAKDNDLNGSNEDEDEEEEVGKTASMKGVETSGRQAGPPRDALSTALLQAAAPSASASSRTRKRAEKKKKQKQKARGNAVADADE